MAAIAKIQGAHGDRKEMFRQFNDPDAYDSVLLHNLPFSIKKNIRYTQEDGRIVRECDQEADFESGHIVQKFGPVLPDGTVDVHPRGGIDFVEYIETAPQR